jgi:AraC-like DNA-binding protein
MGANLVFVVDSEASDVEGPFTADLRIERLTRYVLANLSERLTLARAAEVAGLERTYFSRFFHSAAGCTFSAWNRAIRMEKAKVLLLRKGPSILSIAITVGYTDITTFERAFKKYAGISPRTYRYGSEDSRRKRQPLKPDVVEAASEPA